MVHQHFILVEALTGCTEIILGSENLPMRIFRPKKAKKELKEVSNQYGRCKFPSLISRYSWDATNAVEILKT